MFQFGLGSAVLPLGRSFSHCRHVPVPASHRIARIIRRFHKHSTPLAVLLALGAAVTPGLAGPPATAAASGIQLGEIQVEGVVRTRQPGNSALVLDVISVSLPNGQTNSLPDPRPKTITLAPQTLIFVRGDRTQKVSPNGVSVGIHAIATGPNLGVGKSLPARELEVWDSVRAGFYRLGGLTGGPAVAKPGQPQDAVMEGPVTTTPTQTLPQSNGTVWSVAFAPDRPVLATGGQDGVIQLWDTQAQQVMQSIAAGHPIFAVAFSPDGKLLASGGGDGSVTLWDTGTGKAMAVIPTGNAAVYTVVFSPDGGTVASAGGGNSIQLWTAQTGQPQRSLMGNSRIAGAVLFAPDGKTLVTGNADNTISVFDLQTAQIKQTLQTGNTPTAKLAFSLDGKLLAAGGKGGEVKIWDMQTGEAKQTIKAHPGRVSAIAFSPDGKWIATGGDDQLVKLWDADTGKIHRTYQGHTRTVSSVAFSADSKLLASGSGDRSVRIWSVE